MRILSLHFKNLNSLVGEWKIDFTNPEYLSSGIFAITGPTGAGKSTILDAICLALYGQTPRLGKISSNAGEIMSRQTGEYFSEVEFVSDKGQYRCRWSQRRAYKKPDREPQSPKHEIVDVKTGIPLESKQSKVQEKVIEVTGLDYQQFTRSILLAQGEFATFLDAKADERAPILEKITGTEIYGQISIKVHERFNREKATLETLNAKAENIEMFSPEQAEAFRKEKQDREKALQEISTLCSNCETAVSWLDTIAALEKEISELQEQKQALTARKETAKTDLDALSIARKARDLDGIYAGLSALRAQQESDTKEKKSCEEQLEEFNAVYAHALEAHRSAQEKRDAAFQEKQRDEGIIRQVRDLDTSIREIIAKQDEREKEKRRSEEDIGTYQDTIRSAESEITIIRQDLTSAESYLESHHADKNLVELLPRIEAAFRQFDTLFETKEQRERELHIIEKTLADAEQSLLIRKKEVDKLVNTVKKAETERDRLRQEFADISGGKDSETLRANVDILKDRHARLQVLLDSASRIEEDWKEDAGYVEKITVARNKKNLEKIQHEELLKKEGHTVQLVKLAEEKLLLEARVKSLEEERDKLVAGKPCPLCGSPDHPWSTGVIPVQDTAKRELDTFKKMLEDLITKIRQSEVTLAALDTEIQNSESASGKLRQKITTATTDLERGCRDLGLIVSKADWKPSIAAGLEECTARLKVAREILTQTEEKEREIRLAENRMNGEKDVLSKEQSDYVKAQSYRDEQSRNQIRASKEFAGSIADYTQQDGVISSLLQEYGDILIYSPGEKRKNLLELTERRDSYIATLSRKQELETAHLRCEGDLQKNRALLASAESTLTQVGAILAGIQKDLEANSERRRDLYGEKDPTQEEERITKQVKAAEEAWFATNEAKISADKGKSSCEGQIQALTEKITHRVQVLQEKEEEFSHALARSGFTDENQFISARLPPERLSELETIEANLIREETEISTSLRDTTSKYTKERERALTTASRETLTAEIENQKDQIARLQDDIGRLRINLEQYDMQIAKYHALTDEITKQKKECAKWQKLHELIGSADGKKFRIFAQGLTFENLVVQANRHLHTMSDRYLLVRNRDSPLDLDIMDNYQAGEIRTTKNLSGGERFLVSLALALGLSGMASHNVRIDSLFLDEGFGSLDDDTLETALETLSSLQRDGKIIGMISHVSALKERIAVQIQIEKIGGGRSRLFGPGCSGSS